MSAEPERCLTCSDEAVAARVLTVDGREAVVAVGTDTERVAIDLIPETRPGDVLLCHAGIALERLSDVPGTQTCLAPPRPGARHADVSRAATSSCLARPEAAAT